MTERIDHAAEAQAILDKYRVASVHVVQATLAQVHATLALVEQQRIANLIALLSGGDETAYVLNGEVNSYNRDNWERVRFGICQALGLND